MKEQIIRFNENYINAIISFDRNLNIFCKADK